MVTTICLSDTQNTPNFKYGLEQKNVSLPSPNENQTLIQVQAASLNHRDVYIMKGQFMNITTGGTVWSDFVGLVSQDSSTDEALKAGDRVLVNPGQGWETDVDGPEQEFCMLGLNPCTGACAEQVIVDAKQVFKCPEHLTNHEAAALPLAGLTAYRAAFSKCGIKKDDYVLVTGIGGGVALMALQFAVAVGAHVYVTSSSPEKIQRAIELGAKGGVNYKDADSIDQLKKQLNGKLIKAVIDGAAGPLYGQYPAVMKQGGIIANYGQTSGEPVTFSMYQVAQNIELRGSTMGSRREFGEMIAFVNQYKVKPVVSDVFKGISVESVQAAVDKMESSSQFGKIVLDINQ